MKRLLVGLVLALLVVETSTAGLLNAIAHRPDARGLGLSGAVTAAGEGASALSSNPAGLFWVGDWEFEIGSTFLLTDFEYRPDALLGGGNWDAIDELFPFPEFFLARRVSDDLVVGMGAWVPYGLAADYAGYLPYFQSKVMIGDFAVGAAYSLTDELIFGAAIKAIYGNADFNLPLIMGGNYLGSPHTSADGLGVGASIGLLYVNYPWRLGVSYDIPVSIDIAGHTKFPAVVSLGQQSFDSQIYNPGRLGVGVAYNLNCRWLVAADYFWTDYGDLDSLDVRYNSLPPASIPLGWGNVHSVNLGTEYVPDLPNNWLTLRAGVGWLSSGAPDDTLVPSIPDVPGWDVSLGAGFQISKNLELDVAGMYAWGERDISLAPGCAAAGHHRADIFGVGVTLKYKF